MIDPTFNTTITLFNRYEVKTDNGIEIQWNKTVLENCFFSAVQSTILSDITLSPSFNYVCRIPESDKFLADYSGQSGFFTLHPDDIIVRGEVSDVISDTDGKRAADLLNRYNGRAFTVKEVSINTILPCARHYRASGV